MDMYILLYLKWIANKDLLYSTGNSTQCHVAAWIGGELGENAYIYSMAAAAAKSLQSCLTLRDPMDCSLPRSSVHGIFQAKVLEWVAIAFSVIVWQSPFIVHLKLSQHC